MSDSEIITATEASRKFSDVLHRVCYGGESFVVKKGQRLMARIVPVEAEIEAPRESVKRVPAVKPVGKRPAEKEKTYVRTSSAPPGNPQIAPTSPAVSTRGMSVPEGLTQEDVSFYENLIASIPKSAD